MTTILHFLAWTGAIMAAVFVVLLAVLVPLGLKERFKAKAEARREAAQWVSVPPRRLKAHADWSDIKDRRDRDTPPHDPAS